MCIHEQLLRFLQDANELTYLPLLQEIDLPTIRRMEEDAHSDEYARRKCRKIRELLPSLTIMNINTQRSIFNHFAEVRFYYELRNESVITAIAEGNGPTPDFRIDFEGSALFGEVKSISMAGSDANYTGVIWDAFGAELEFERQRRQGRRACIAEFVIQPARRAEGDRNYDSRSARAVIEVINTKIRDLFNPAQFALGPTILFADLSQWALGCDAVRSLIPCYHEEWPGSNGSGVLWQVAFGRLGDLVFRPPEFEGASSDDGTLATQGLLLEFQTIAGVVFRYGLGDRARFLGLCQANQETPVARFIRQVADHVNDDQNTYGHQLEMAYQQQFPPPGP